MKFYGEEPVETPIRYGESAAWRKWGLGVWLPVGLIGTAVFGLVTGNTWTFFNGESQPGADSFWIFQRVTGKAAMLYAIGHLGAALALFGWNFAPESEWLCLWWEKLTGLGCLIALVFFPWGFYVWHLGAMF